jgi:hypothetical protein
MHIIHESTVKQTSGLYEVSIYIVNEYNNFKKYIYKIGSEWAVRQFHMYYRKGTGMHGTALTILNRFKEKEK